MGRFHLALACRTDDLVGEIEKLIESEPLAIPDLDASVAERVAEVLKHIVGRFAGLAPRARVREGPVDSFSAVFISHLAFRRPCRFHSRGRNR